MAYPSKANVEASVVYLEAIFTEDPTLPQSRQYWETLKALTSLIQNMVPATYADLVEQDGEDIGVKGVDNA